MIRSFGFWVFIPRQKIRVVNILPNLRLIRFSNKRIAAGQDSQSPDSSAQIYPKSAHLD